MDNLIFSYYQSLGCFTSKPDSHFSLFLFEGNISPTVSLLSQSDNSCGAWYESHVGSVWPQLSPHCLRLALQILDIWLKASKQIELDPTFGASVKPSEWSTEQRNQWERSVSSFSLTARHQVTISLFVSAPRWVPKSAKGLKRAVWSISPVQELQRGNPSKPDSE